MSGFVFPQDVRDETTGTKVRREGGLSKRELAAMIFAAHEVALCDLFHASGRLSDDIAEEVRHGALNHSIKCADALLLMLEIKK